MQLSNTLVSLLAVAASSIVDARPSRQTADATNSRIKNVVVLIMENRSFDSVFGRLKWDGINTRVDGLTGNEYNDLDNGQRVMIQRGTNPAAGFDPNHEVHAVTEQIYGSGTVNAAGQVPDMSGFAQQAFVESQENMDSVKQVMQAFGPDTLPVTYALAKEFAVVDNWFASMPGPTYPNRHFAHCATGYGYTGNTDSLIGVGCKTVFGNLDAAGVSWGVYSDAPLATTLLYRDMRSIPHLKKTYKFGAFIKDAAAGKLPQYTFLDPNNNFNDDHPPNNLHNGQKFIKDTYEALRSSPQWENTLFLITYDENGGFYDHVTPPTNVPIPDSSEMWPAVGDFKFERLGPRVPALVISPYVPKGAVIHSNIPGRNYEHSSIPATLKKIFGLPSFLTKRDAWAIPFDSIASLSSPRKDCIVKLPLHKPFSPHPKQEKK
ncbi:hypothetical protein BSLG_003545 [Batrachochytrium salamandrivorans]|nr:hypothetical protein BSLG_003545 [Batrachochytrium salamandrivorans]